MIRPAIIPDAPLGAPPHLRPASISIAEHDDGDAPEHGLTHAVELPPAPSEPVAFPKPAKSARPRARLLTAANVPLERVRWLWDQHIPAGMLSLIGGRPGAGKSSLAISIAATITRGGYWPDGTRCDAQGDALYWTSEDAPGVIRARAQACRADLARFHLIDGDASGNAFDPAHHARQLDAALELLPDARVIVLDPIINAISTDAHKAGDVRRALAPLLDIASRRNIALIGITHFRKGSDADDPVERLIGSQAFGAVARCVWLASKDAAQAGQTHDRLFALGKCNIGHDERAWRYGLYREPLADGIEGQCVGWGEAVAGNARELLARAEAVPGGDDGEDDARTDRQELIALIRDALAAGPRPASDIYAEAKQAGFEARAVRRAMRQAGARTQKTGVNGGWVWVLPSQGDTPHQEPAPCPLRPLGISATFSSEGGAEP